jgi:hypothetical protein
MLAHERKQLLVLLVVLDVPRVRLNDENPQRPTLGLERDSQPARLLVDDTDELELVPFDESVNRSYGISWGSPVRRT